MNITKMDSEEMYQKQGLIRYCWFWVSWSVLPLYYDLNIDIILINMEYLMKPLNLLFLYLKSSQIKLVNT